MTLKLNYSDTHTLAQYMHDIFTTLQQKHKTTGVFF